jgi:hypothetical protein
LLIVTVELFANIILLYTTPPLYGPAGHDNMRFTTNYSYGNFQAAEIHITFHITLEQESQEM